MRHTWPLLSPEAIPLRCLTAIVMFAVGRCVSQAGGWRFVDIISLVRMWCGGARVDAVSGVALSEYQTLRLSSTVPSLSAFYNFV